MYWVVVILLLISKIVSAECSWIFWEKTVSADWTSQDYKERETWEINSATKTQEQCEAGLNAIWKHRLSEYQKVPSIDVKSGPGFIGAVYPPIKGQYHSATISFLCLPDTIDPRESKR